MKRDLTEEEVTLVYGLTQNMARKLQDFKDYDTAYSNPGNGRILVKYKGQIFLVEATPLKVDTEKPITLDEAWEEYKYLFK